MAPVPLVVWGVVLATRWVDRVAQVAVAQSVKMGPVARVVAVERVARAVPVGPVERIAVGTREAFY